ncbi:hypothetical protein JMA_28940 [Jeotgalibacillus malaysiensis]|uniref:Peptidase S8/S53 domain-containing protein n=1 Tax=Jeotgalibacillus malaysiensis TaxID=1508404 RepID=A0A0B5AQ29_9BACL|nr:cell wall-binding repeat-containing protein [Jeotgalibacillus malaysiensis]AJD92211.1 hypothetical protein JMA_28940 [Jeotgalibacillus malaysiensis]
MNQLLKVLISFALVLSVFATVPVSQISYGAQEIEAVPLEEKIEVNRTIDADMYEEWFRIDLEPEQIQQFSHFEISVQSDHEVSFSTYSSAELAINDQTFDFYRSYAFPDQSGSVQFPIAWEGPYYIKVESYSEEFIEDFEEQAEHQYTISFKGIDLNSSRVVYEEQCPAEIVLEDDSDLLENLKTIRGDMLSQTEKGRELTKLYYKTAPFISYKVLTDAEAKKTLTQSLTQLKGLIGNIAGNGFYSTQVISTDDQNAINSIYDLALDAAPGKVEAEIKKTGEAIGIRSIKNRSVFDVMLKGGYIKNDTSSNRVIVKLKSGQSLDKVKSATTTIDSVTTFDATSPEFKQFVIVDLTPGLSSAKFNQTVKTLEGLPEIEFIEPVQEYTLHSQDIYYDEQWSLNNTGEGRGVKDADIKYEQMIELLDKKEMTETVTAVLDTGVDYTLADLKNQVISTGYDFINNDSDAMDDEGHGTHVSGIIAAESDNGYSMTGINQHTGILPVKVLDASGSGDTEKIAYGIIYAADQGADMINMSLGGPYSRVLEYAMKYASEKGVTIVAASGNEGYGEVSYPASSKYTIAVGATNRLDIVSDYSSYGKGLDLVAPGSDIPSLVPNGNTILMSGTSMATPHVTAVAGLVKSIKPDITAEQIRKVLTISASDIAFTEEDPPVYYDEDPFYDDFPYYPEELAPGYDLVSGWGRLNAPAALTALDNKWNLSERISGNDRYNTAVKVSQEGWETSNTVVLATGQNYPDALSATPLASYYNAPLLLVREVALPESVREEIKRLKAKEVIIIGGESVLSSYIELELQMLGISEANVRRISGENRYSTSAKIANEIKGANKAVLATGQTFADALSIAPIAGSEKMPILLTKANSLPAETKSHLSQAKYTETFIIGGNTAISDSVYNEVKNPVRISGQSRYETNTAIITHFADSISPAKMYLATGLNYPDALSGSVLAAKYQAPLILTAPEAPRATTKQTVSILTPDSKEIFILGGENALPSESVQTLFE